MTEEQLYQENKWLEQENAELRARIDWLEKQLKLTSELHTNPEDSWREGFER